MFSFLFRRAPVFSRDQPFEEPQHQHLSWQSKQHGSYAPLPRSLVYILPRRPFLDWAREHGADQGLTMLRLTGSLAYLIPTMDGQAVEAEDFVKHHWDHFFAQALEAWETDTEQWPRPRNLTLFYKWFEVRYAETVLDLGGYTEGQRFGGESTEYRGIAAPRPLPKSFEPAPLYHACGESSILMTPAQIPDYRGKP